MEKNLSLFVSDLTPSEKLSAALWRLIEALLFRPFLSPTFLRIHLLRMFGARIHKSAIIKSGVKVLFPWKLKVGENSWIGEGVWFINHEEILIGDNVCISQGATICASGHDYKTTDFRYRHSAVHVNDGAWICLKAIILPGSQIGDNSVISAGEVFSGRIASDSIYQKGKSRLID